MGNVNKSTHENVLLIGEKGSGKTTFLYSTFGSEMISEDLKPTIGFNCELI